MGALGIGQAPKDYMTRKYNREDDIPGVDGLLTAIIESAIVDLKTQKKNGRHYKTAKQFINDQYAKDMMEHIGVDYKKIYRKLKEGGLL